MDNIIYGIRETRQKKTEWWDCFASKDKAMKGFKEVKSYLKAFIQDDYVVTETISSGSAKKLDKGEPLVYGLKFSRIDRPEQDDEVIYYELIPVGKDDEDYNMLNEYLDRMTKYHSQ